MPFETEVIKEAASAIDVKLSENDINSYREALTTAMDRASRLETSVYEGEPPDDLTEGEDPLNAFLYRFSDKKGEGDLSGLEVAVKDNMAVTGVPMTCGSAAVSFIPEYDATVVSRLRKAGAEIVGTTNMDEFALFTTGETCVHGPTENPMVTNGVPGGSSSGSGAAVAADFVDAALGSDTGGSIRIPASFCGIVGLKPTYRSIPRFGFADLAPSLDHIGPLARDVKTACRVYDAIAGPDPRDPSTLLTDPPVSVSEGTDVTPSEASIGVIEEAIEMADGGVQEVVKETTEKLGNAGLNVETLSLPNILDVPDAVLGISGPEFTKLFENGGQTFGFGTGYSDSWRQAIVSLDRGKLGSTALDTLLLNRALLNQTEGSMYVAAQNERRKWLQSVSEVLTDMDALVTPTTPMTAPGFGDIQGTEGLLDTIALTSPFNLTGHPAMSVPCGYVGDRPVGLQIVSDWHDETMLLQIGVLIENLS